MNQPFWTIARVAGLLAGWIGWASIIWSVVWLLILPVVSPRDIYFPVMHSVLPLIMGTALLVQVV